MFLRLIIGILSIFGNQAQTVGSTGCTTPVCVFANSNLRFGTGTENSVNAKGLFQQPWYYSEISRVWYKLTYSSYPLDTAIGMGSGSSQWSGTTVYDIYNLPSDLAETDYSNFVVTSTDSAKTVGYGTIIANRTLTVGSTYFIFQNIFSLGENDKFVKIVTSIINTSPNTLQNLIIWTGTRDDFVGNTDSNSKTRGNLNTGSFVPITAIGQSSRAIMISNTNEGVLFYSETPGVMTSFSMCCAFSNAYNTNPNTQSIATTSPTDGSYAAVLPVGNVATGVRASITWFYAAGTISSLSSVAQSVAAAQVADSGGSASTVSPLPSAVQSLIATMSNYPSVSPLSISSFDSVISYNGTHSSVGSASALFSVSPMFSRSSLGSASALFSVSSLGSASSVGSGSPVFSRTPLRSVSSVGSASSIGSVSSVGSASSVGSGSPVFSRTSVGSGSPVFSRTPLGSGSPVFSVSPLFSGSSVGTLSSVISHNSTPSSVNTPSPEFSNNPTVTPVYTSSSTESSTETSTSSSTSTPSPTPSSTSSFPIHVILVPLNDTNHITSVTVLTNSQESLSTSLYVLVSVNLLLALGCVCCSISGLCLIRKIYKNKKEEDNKVFHLRSIA
jgi:hypothetical protein